MKALEAREILNDSNQYLKEIMENIFKEVETQAKQGQNWAHVNLHSRDSEKLIDRVRSELTLLGYNVESSNSWNHFTIKW